MEKLDLLSEGFRLKYERFMNSCDMQENLRNWDVEENGDMDVFFLNYLVSFILRIVAADGRISKDEVKYVNETFGFRYSKEDLTAAYEECKDVIGAEFEDQFRKDLELMRSVSEVILRQYLDLLDTVCDIIIRSDGIVDRSETEEAKRIRALVQSA